MLIICILIILFLTFLFYYGSSKSLVNGKSLLYQGSIILAIILFSLLVGLRYNNGVDMDFKSYCEIVKLGDKHYYYNHLELLPKLFVDIVHRFTLPAYSWFIMMGASLIFFLVFALRNEYKKYIAWAFIWFVLLHFSFAMNVMRQGVALTAFLCAVTCIPNRKWKEYILFVGIAFCFHRTSIIWSPLYLLTYLDWENKHWRYYSLLAISVVVIFGALSFFITKLSFVFDIMNMTDKIKNVKVVGRAEDIVIGSGLGILLRYIRWGAVFITSLIIARINNDRSLYILLGIFLIGIVMNPFSMLNIAAGRVGLYLQITEILIYPYIYDSVDKLKYGILLKLLMIIQLLVLSYQSIIYLSKWNFVKL